MEDLSQYQTNEGAYLSPKNGKIYKSLKSFRAHWTYAGHVRPDSFKSRLYDVHCRYCCEEIGISNIKKHENRCYLNPINTIYCKVCSEPIKHYNKSKGTCSRSCSNVYFRSGRNNGNWNDDQYRSTCWEHHEKKCVVCGEDKIVAVHHYDENHSNNDPVNLIPMCPTHHQYMHSRYKIDIQNIVDEYIIKYKLRFGV
jgi:hypothetical protein